jgi:DNA modification methylase
MYTSENHQYSISQGDCLSEIKAIPDKSIDLVLTDPPYNLGLFMENRDTNLGALRNNHFTAANWDHIEQNEWETHIDEFFEQSRRILKKRGALVIFMAIIKVETIIKIAQRHGFYYKTTGIWHKKNPMPRNMNLHFINSTESWIYFINEGKTGKFNNAGKAIHDFFESSTIGSSEKKYGNHPTQKPQLLMEHFIELLTDEGDSVLDPFMGSGSTGIAAIKKNRKFHGVELNETYFKISLERLRNASC